MNWREFLPNPRWTRESTIADVVRQAMDEAIRDVQRKYASLKTVDSLNAIKVKLQEEIETMKIGQGRMKEEHQRDLRTIEHKVGLHKMRQEQEIELAKREAHVSANEGHLEQKEKAFKERMDFFQGQLESQTKYLKDMMEKMLERLPSAEIIARIGGIEATKKED